MAEKILRIFTIIVIGITSFGLLIGGSYIYKQFIFTDPLEKSLLKMETVKISDFTQNEKSLYLTAEFNSSEELQPNFYLLINQIQEERNNSLENCVVEIKNNTHNKELASFLKAAKLPLYEAINTGLFTALPEQLASLSQEDKITYDLELDNQFIFITANIGNDYAHLIINNRDNPLKLITTIGEEYI